MTQWVYSFGADLNEGGANMRNLLGGKGANLAEMAGIGLPVPPGFTITTEVCTAFYDNDSTYPPDLKPQVRTALARIEKAPGFVQPMIIKNAEAAARANGSNFVTIKLLDELQAKQGSGAAPGGDRR